MKLLARLASAGSSPRSSLSRAAASWTWLRAMSRAGDSNLTVVSLQYLSPHPARSK
jgi:hypothetical protein